MQSRLDFTSETTDVAGEMNKILLLLLLLLWKIGTSAKASSLFQRRLGTNSCSATSYQGYKRKFPILSL